MYPIGLDTDVAVELPLRRKDAADDVLLVRESELRGAARPPEARLFMPVRWRLYVAPLDDDVRLDVELYGEDCTRTVGRPPKVYLEPDDE